MKTEDRWTLEEIARLMDLCQSRGSVVQLEVDGLKIQIAPRAVEVAMPVEKDLTESEAKASKPEDVNATLAALHAASGRVG